MNASPSDGDAPVSRSGGGDGVEPAVAGARTRVLGVQALRHDGGYVLYWMTAARRLRWNHALDRAVSWSLELGRPLVILEALRAGYEFASRRLHRFVLDGMADKAALTLPRGITYLPYVEPAHGEGSGLLELLMGDAAVVVADDFPAFSLPLMVDAAAARSPVRFEAVDANGLLPMAVVGRAYPSAYHFRRVVQKSLPDWLDPGPSEDPFAHWSVADVPVLPAGLDDRWPMATADQLISPGFLAGLPVDASVGPVAYRGGEKEGARVLRTFLSTRLSRYATDRNHPDREAVSELSPYLHFGHVSTHQVFNGLASSEGWTPLRLGSTPSGKREGWWGMSASAEAFLDQLVTWRELGFNQSRHDPDHRRYGALPDWARTTLREHVEDPRAYVYEPEEFEAAETHDPIWNAAQRELRTTGRIHNYLRMLWGKKILEWSEDPQTALAIMLELNDRYAVDGRDPNSYSGIFWILGRYDRPWPERAVFGKVRSMSSERTRQKVEMEEYLRRFAPSA